MTTEHDWEEGSPLSDDIIVSTDGVFNKLRSNIRSCAVIALLAIIALLVVVIIESALLAHRTTSAAPAQCNAAPYLIPPPPFHAELRQKLLSELTTRTLVPVNSLIFLQGAQETTRFYSDTELPFRQESNFLYATGWEGAGAQAVVSASGLCYLFVPEPTLSDAIWNGRVQTLDEIRAEADVDEVFYLKNFTTVLAELQPTLVFTLPDVIVPAALAAVPYNDTQLLMSFARARAVKTSAEIALMTKSAHVSGQAHVALMQQARIGMYEFQLADLFSSYCSYCNMPQAYLPIVGSGNNTAVLHYVTERNDVLAGELVLVDASAEFHGYASDITRTWPASGQFSAEQQIIYSIVLETQSTAIDAMLAGVSFSNVSALAARTMLQGLLQAGILHNGTVEQLYTARMQNIFQPHGLGHLIGLDVHDPMVYPQLLDPPMLLTSGMVMTCEPGCYFVPPLLLQALSDPVQSVYVNAEVLQRFVAVGGVRIEDVVLVTDSVPMLLSEVLSSVIDIERLRAATV